MRAGWTAAHANGRDGVVGEAAGRRLAHRVPGCHLREGRGPWATPSHIDTGCLPCPGPTLYHPPGFRRFSQHSRIGDKKAYRLQAERRGGWRSSPIPLD